MSNYTQSDQYCELIQRYESNRTCDRIFLPGYIKTNINFVKRKKFNNGKNKKKSETNQFN